MVVTEADPCALGFSEINNFEGSPLVTVRGRAAGIKSEKGCCMSFPMVNGDRNSGGVRIFTGNCWRIAGVVKPAGCVKESTASPADREPILIVNTPDVNVRGFGLTVATSGFVVTIGMTVEIPGLRDCSATGIRVAGSRAKESIAAGGACAYSLLE